MSGVRSGGWLARLPMVAALAAVALVAVGCSESPEPGTGKPDVIFGATNAITGPVSSTCKPATDGATAWFASVNAADGINGHKINYKVLDDAYDPARAVANGRSLINDGAVAVVSGCGTATSLAVNPILNAKGVPQIMPYSSLPTLVKDPAALFFAGLPLYGRQISGVVGYAMNSRGSGKLILVSPTQPGSTEFIDAAQSAATAAGGQWLGVEIVQNGQADFTPTVLKLKGAKPDYVMLAVGAGDAAKFIKAAGSQGFAPGKAWLGYSSVANEVFLNAMGTSVDGKIILGTPTAFADMPAAKTCVDAITKYGDASSISALTIYGCSVAQVITKVAETIKGDISSKALVDALQAVNGQQLAEALPPISFSPVDHAGIDSSLIVEVKDGKFTVVGTRDLPAQQG